MSAGWESSPRHWDFDRNLVFDNGKWVIWGWTRVWREIKMSMGSFPEKCLIPWVGVRGNKIWVFGPNLSGFWLFYEKLKFSVFWGSFTVFLCVWKNKVLDTTDFCSTESVWFGRGIFWFIFKKQKLEMLLASLPIMLLAGFFDNKLKFCIGNRRLFSVPESSHVGDGHWSQLGARFRSSQWKWKSITGGETEIAGRGHIVPGAAQTLSDRSLNRKRKVFAGPVKFLRSALLSLDVCLVVCNTVTSEPCVWPIPGSRKVWGLVG